MINRTIVTKWILLLIGVIGVSGLMFSNPYGYSCEYESTCWETLHWFNVTSMFLTLTIPFSIASLFIRDEMFKIWFGFTLLWLPLGIVFAGMGSQTNGSFIGFPSNSTLAVFAFGIVYLLVSSAIVIWAFLPGKAKLKK